MKSMKTQKGASCKLSSNLPGYAIKILQLRMSLTFACFFVQIKYQQLSGHKGAVTTCTYTAKCTRVLTSSYDTTCKLWDVQTNKTLRTYRGHTRNVSKLSVSDDGKK